MNTWQPAGWGNYNTVVDSQLVNEAKASLISGTTKHGDVGALWAKRMAEIITNQFGAFLERQELYKRIGIIIRNGGDEQERLFFPDDELLEKFVEVQRMVLKSPPNFRIQAKQLESAGPEAIKLLMERWAEVLADDEKMKLLNRISDSYSRKTSTEEHLMRRKEDVPEEVKGKGYSPEHDIRFSAAKYGEIYKKRLEKQGIIKPEEEKEQVVPEETPVDMEKIEKAAFLYKFAPLYIKMPVFDGQYTVEEIAEDLPEIIDVLDGATSIFDMLEKLLELTTKGGELGEVAGEIYERLKEPLIRGSEAAVSSDTGVSSHAFIATTDPAVIERADAWGQKHNGEYIDTTRKGESKPSGRFYIDGEHVGGAESFAALSLKAYSQSRSEQEAKSRRKLTAAEREKEYHAAKQSGGAHEEAGIGQLSQADITKINKAATKWLMKHGGLSREEEQAYVDTLRREAEIAVEQGIDIDDVVDDITDTGTVDVEKDIPKSVKPEYTPIADEYPTSDDEESTDDDDDFAGLTPEQKAKLKAMRKQAPKDDFDEFDAFGESVKLTPARTNQLLQEKLQRARQYQFLMEERFGR